MYKLKASNGYENSVTQFFLRSKSNGFRAAYFRKVSLNGNMYDISVDYNSIEKSDILNIDDYLLTSNNIK